MKSLAMRLLLPFFFLILLSFTVETDCSIMKDGTFVYGNNDEYRVVINGNKMTEYHNDGKHIIKSKLKWISDCEYEVTILKNTVPDVPFKKGTSMRVEIIEVKGNEVFYKSHVNGHVWDGKFTKVED